MYAATPLRKETEASALTLVEKYFISLISVDLGHRRLREGNALRACGKKHWVEAKPAAGSWHYNKWTFISGTSTPYINDNDNDDHRTKAEPVGIFCDSVPSKVGRSKLENHHHTITDERARKRVCSGRHRQ